MKINLFKCKRFKDGRCTYKNTGSSHLKSYIITCDFVILDLQNLGKWRVICTELIFAKFNAVDNNSSELHFIQCLQETVQFSSRCSFLYKKTKQKQKHKHTLGTMKMLSFFHSTTISIYWITQLISLILTALDGDLSGG